MKRRLLMAIILITGFSLMNITGVLGQEPQTQPKKQKPDTTKNMKKKPADTAKVKPTPKPATKKYPPPDSLQPRKDRPVDTVYRK